MVAGPGVLVVVMLMLVVLVVTWRLREPRTVVRRDTVAVASHDTRRSRRDAAVREARRRLEHRVLDTPLTTSDLTLPRQRVVRGR